MLAVVVAVAAAAAVVVVATVAVDGDGAATCHREASLAMPVAPRRGPP